jgi:hypothetical protein
MTRRRAFPLVRGRIKIAGRKHGGSVRRTR